MDLFTRFCMVIRDIFFELGAKEQPILLIHVHVHFEYKLSANPYVANSR